MNAFKASVDVSSDAVYAFNAFKDDNVDALNEFKFVTDVFKLAVVLFKLVICTPTDELYADCAAAVDAVYALNEAVVTKDGSLNTVIDAISPFTFGTILAETNPLKKNLVDVPILVPLTRI